MGAVSGFPSLFSCSSPHREALRSICLSVRITPRFPSHRFGACLGGALRFPAAWLFLVCGNSMNSRKDPSPPAAAQLPLSGAMTFTASPAEDKPCPVAFGRFWSAACVGSCRSGISRPRVKSQGETIPISCPASFSCLPVVNGGGQGRCWRRCWTWLSKAGACEMYRDAASISPCPKDTGKKATPRAHLQSQTGCFQPRVSTPVCLETILKLSRGISAPSPRGIHLSPCSL